MAKTSPPDHGKPAREFARKPRALSLHVGLNLVDPKHYAGWSGPLMACEFDANDMASIAKNRGMSSTVLLTKAATRKAVLSALRSAVGKLSRGDLFFLSFSGHGGQVPDSTAAPDEDDKQDETWCLYDGQLIDDELYVELGRFAGGVRILVLSDSCHSGTVTRAPPVSMGTQPPGLRSKLMPPEVGRRVYELHQAFYDELQSRVMQAARPAQKFRPAAILISGCQDNQTSLDGEHNGAFTARLRQVWNGGKFSGPHARLHATIKAGMPASQTPNLFLLGDAAAFMAQQPFTF
ncbi:MAG: caspase family protein [Burkholderiaceae bacterium]